MAIRPNVLSALRRFTSCDVGDALVKLGVSQGGYLSGLKMYSPDFMSPTAKFLGPAYTVKMVHASDKVSPTPKVHFADAIPKDSVVFVSQPKGLISACWGGLMSTRAQKRGAAGVIIDGKFRDINEHRELGMTRLSMRTQKMEGRLSSILVIISLEMQMGWWSFRLKRQKSVYNSARNALKLMRRHGVAWNRVMK